MKKNIIVLIICLLVLAFSIGIIIFKLTNNNVSNDSREETSIDFFAMQTHGGFNDITRNTKYKITNQEELEMFYTLYDGFELSKEYDLSKNTIFIQTEVYGSGSVNVKFDGVNINKRVKFYTTTNSPEIGTTDMAYWYLVAIIPNTKLKGIDIDEWKSPVDINNSFKNEYTISIESPNLDLKDSLSIVEKTVNDIGSIIIEDYHYSHSENKKIYTLISYDEKISKQLIQKINNEGNGMKAELFSTEKKDEIEYKEFQDRLSKKITPYYHINLWSNSINNYKSWRNYY